MLGILEPPGGREPAAALKSPWETPSIPRKGRTDGRTDAGKGAGRARERDGSLRLQPGRGGPPGAESVRGERFQVI